ncbi:MAG TPA: malto-oligosyltrehalose trehalohydrolase [Candidatus Sulfotelmatobacter sp.]|jgi:maltooligosyltrehalose trehalohydrolase|nr:malto-oligosyltrehalose trehalohydrolase [Candidatus Sulfotelmatobacter sp.]
MLSTEAVIQETRVGATRQPDGDWEFLVWAPQSRSVTLHLVGRGTRIAMESLANGYHRAIVKMLESESEYFYQLDGERELPDPASRFQAQGVHGPSHIVDPQSFQWSDCGWKGPALERSVFYELHVGTYTPEGTFDAVIARLPELVDLGITTIELMPVAQFPGARNWGYDGVYLFAPQNTYGGPKSLQRLVNAAHQQGLAVALDVVYNHLGPEGNYLSAYGPYFTDRYRSPWGQAINFDGAGSDEVRRFFIENALYWLEDYHFDALRLDAVHGIFDFGARHLLVELKMETAKLSQRLGRPIHLIAESDLNDARLLHRPERGGYDLDAQWSDDFHHSVHTLLTGENQGYYADFGGPAPLAATLRDGWYYSGQHSKHRNRRHGNSARGISPARFVVCNQNHDQVGNRAAGERLSTLVDFEAQKLAAGITLLSPFVPLLFMGEEYGETAPFQYFTSHGDPALVEAVRRGRREEFAAFGWTGSVPDPQDEETFSRSHLNHSLKEKERHRTLFSFYQELIRLREEQELGSPGPRTVRELGGCALLVLRQRPSGDLAMISNFADFRATLNLPDLSGDWTQLIYSAEARWKGPETDRGARINLAANDEMQLSPHSFLVLERIQPTTEPV